jgi:tRNA pseudouridine55 synthase
MSTCFQSSIVNCQKLTVIKTISPKDISVLLRYPPPMRHGFLLINKPRGPTSHDIVARVRSALGESSIGHLGTLDPLADGLLVLAVGKRALKVVELFAGLNKEYVAELTLGAESTTYDAEGMITVTTLKAGWLPPTDVSSIQALIADRFVGKIKQVPPAFSAVHIGGERAYRKAMRGEHVELKAREASILSCAVESYQYPLLKLRVACGSGTYIRSLAHDLGQSMRCGAYLSALTRTRVGEWRVEDAQDLTQVAWTDVVPLKEVLRQFAGREVSAEDWEHLQHGRSIDGVLPQTGPYFAWFQDLPVAILDRDPRAEARLKPRKVL